MSAHFALFVCFVLFCFVLFCFQIFGEVSLFKVLQNLFRVFPRNQSLRAQVKQLNAMQSLGRLVVEVEFSVRSHVDRCCCDGAAVLTASGAGSCGSTTETLPFATISLLLRAEVRAVERAFNAQVKIQMI